MWNLLSCCLIDYFFLFHVTDATCLLNSGIVHLTCSGYQKEASFWYSCHLTFNFITWSWLFTRHFIRSIRNVSITVENVLRCNMLPFPCVFSCFGRSIRWYGILNKPDWFEWKLGLFYTSSTSHQTLSFLKKAAPCSSDIISTSYSRCLMSGLLSSRLADTQASSLSQVHTHAHTCIETLECLFFYIDVQRLAFILLFFLF